MSFEIDAGSTGIETAEAAGRGKPMKIVVTGGAAFEAAALCAILQFEYDARVVYLGSAGAVQKSEAFSAMSASAKFASFDLDPADLDAAIDVMRFEQPDAIIELATAKPDAQTTERNLAVAGAYWSELARARKTTFRFVHAWPAASANPHGYGDSEPVVAERFAAAGIPALSVRCDASFGPYQSPLAQLPMWIANGILGRELPLANLGLDRSGRLAVEDLARGLIAAAIFGAPGSRYALESGARVGDLELLHRLCEILDDKAPRVDGASHAAAIVFDVAPDLSAHSDIPFGAELPAPGPWRPLEPLEDALGRLADWQLAHASWWMPQRLAAVAAEAAPAPAPAKSRDAA